MLNGELCNVEWGRGGSGQSGSGWGRIVATPSRNEEQNWTEAPLPYARFESEGRFDTPIHLTWKCIIFRVRLALGLALAL